MKQSIPFRVKAKRFRDTHSKHVLVWFSFNCMGNLKKKVYLFNPRQSFPSSFGLAKEVKYLLFTPHRFRKKYANSKVASYRKQIRLKNRVYRSSGQAAVYQLGSLPLRSSPVLPTSF